MDHENAIQHQADGIYCTACKDYFKFTKPSKIQRHIDSNIHRKNTERIS